MHLPSRSRRRARGLPALLLVAVFAAFAVGAQRPARAQPSRDGDEPGASTMDEQPVAQGQPKLTPPVLVDKTPAEYPKEAAAEGLSGVVVLEFTVDEKGQIGDVTVKQPAGHGFDEAAVAAVRRFHYQPGLLDGTPVPVRVTYAYKFAIQLVPKAPPAVPTPAAAVPSPEGRGPATEPAPVRISGLVLARGTRTPVSDARVVAIPAAGPPGESIEVETDAHGAFAIRGLPDGDVEVRVAGPGLDKKVFHETLGARQVLDVRYFVDRTWAARYQSTVRSLPDREEVSRQTLTTEELTKMPGSFGDALRAIENLPGVARAPFNVGLLIVRGGKPSDSRAFISGAEVPQLYHFGGLTSVLPAWLFDKVDYYPGNFGVRYGRATAGVIDVDLREGKRDRLHGYFDTNLFDTGAAVEGPLGKGSFIIGARRSYVDAILGAGATSLLPALGLGPPPVNFVTAPVYYDYQALLDYPLWGGKLRAMLLGSDDTLKLLFDSPQADPTVRGSFSTHIWFDKLQLRWIRTSGPVTLFVQSSDGVNGSDADLSGGVKFSITNFEHDSRVEVRWKMSDRLRLTVGADSQLAYALLDALVPDQPREGQLPLPLAAADKSFAHEKLGFYNLGLYAELKWKMTDKITLTPGVRVDYFSALSSVSYNPRLGARWQIFSYTAIKAGAGVYSQDPQPQDYDPVFGNPKLRPESALHLAVSVEQGLFPGMMLEATGFYKYLWDLVTPVTGDVQRDGHIVPERVANIGTGRIYGGELVLRQSLSKWFFGWIAYTLMRSERQDCPTCQWRLFDYDQTHIFVVALHANLPWGLEAGVRWRYISGFPYTLATGGHLDADGDVYVPGHFPVNTARLGAFHQLDIRVDKTFVFERWLLKAYVDLTNVYNNPNQEQAQYSYDYTKQAALTGLPFIPSFGVRGEF